MKFRAERVPPPLRPAREAKGAYSGLYRKRTVRDKTMAAKLTGYVHAIGILASLAGGAAQAQLPELMIIDGGYTELCTQAAHQLEDPGNIPLTGTRLGVEPIELCTWALREAVSPFNRAGNYNNRGVLLFDARRYEEALADFEQALRVDGTLAKAELNRGYTLVALERWEEAVSAFDRGIALGLDETAPARTALGAHEAARAHFSRAISHEELGEVREAYRDYRRAAELDPQWEEPRRELGRFSVRRSGG